MKYVASIFLLIAVAVAQNPVVRTGTTGVVDLSSASATQPARKGAGAPSGHVFKVNNTSGRMQRRDRIFIFAARRIIGRRWPRAAAASR